MLRAGESLADQPPPASRPLAQDGGFPPISIICEKLTYVGVTRFEDDTRLPLGIAINSSSYAAKALTQVGGASRGRLVAGVAMRSSLYPMPLLRGCCAAHMTLCRS